MVPLMTNPANFIGKNDSDFVDFILNRRPPHVAPDYDERKRLVGIFEDLTGYGAVLSGLNRLRGEQTISPDVKQRILTLQEDLVKWRNLGEG